MNVIKIDNKDYNLEDLSDNARAQIASVQTADLEIVQLQSKLALTQTARNAYALSLADQLPEVAHANKKKQVVVIDEKKYALEDFSEAAMAELNSLQITDQKLAQLQSELAIAQTARNAYASAAKTELE